MCARARSLSRAKSEQSVCTTPPVRRTAHCIARASPPGPLASGPSLRSAVRLLLGLLPGLLPGLLLVLLGPARRALLLVLQPARVLSEGVVPG